MRERSSTRVLWMALVLGGLGFAVLPAAAKKPAKPIVADQAMERLFDGAQPAIRECALSQAIYKGATAVELQAMMMISRDGSVFSAQVTAKLSPSERAPSPTPLQECVGAALRKMKFPASNDTFRKLLRTWKFATG